MKSILILTPETKKESWLESAREQYCEKIGHFCTIKYLAVKSPSAAREKSEQKIAGEEQSLLKAIKPEDYVILLDEKGKVLTSPAFSKQLINLLEGGGSDRLVFLIGGAFGVSDKVRARAQLTLRLSDLVFAHTVAQLVLLEQIYRGFAIARGLPYHND